LSAATTARFLLALSLSSCVLAPPLYWAEAIHARVIDADTGAPVQGAVIVADWKLYGGGIGHGGHRESLFVEETTTDANGEFTFGKWGPKKRPAYAALDTAPWLVIFKNGYGHRFLPNEAESNARVRRSDWNARTIELGRFVGTPEQRVDALRTVLSLSGLQPVMLAEIAKESRLYRRVAPAFFDHVERLATGRREGRQ
jgi:hypothetical protein